MPNERDSALTRLGILALMLVLAYLMISVLPVAMVGCRSESRAAGTVLAIDAQGNADVEVKKVGLEGVYRIPFGDQARQLQVRDVLVFTCRKQEKIR